MVRQLQFPKRQSLSVRFIQDIEKDNLKGRQKENGMKKAIVVDANDVRKILAEHFGVKEENVIKSQYSYTIITEKEENNNEVN